MKTPVRLAVYGAALVAAFGAAFGLAAIVVPDSVVAGWEQRSETATHGSAHDAAPQPANTAHGVAISDMGYRLSPVTAPTSTGITGPLSFQILDEAGAPATAFATTHDKDLHLIVVRSDGSQYRHVHPVLDQATGIWSVPSWTWKAGGSYRVYADFTPIVHGAAENDAAAMTDGAMAGEAITLTRSVDVAGEFTPVAATDTRTDVVDDYTVSLDGQLRAGTTNNLVITVQRGGLPVTTLQPYLAAFGHLVALREGDLAYLHVHALGNDPRPGETAGPRIAFAATPPTAGRYQLYLDFRVDDQVHTAEFVVSATQ